MTIDDEIRTSLTKVKERTTPRGWKVLTSMMLLLTNEGAGIIECKDPARADTILLATLNGFMLGVARAATPEFSGKDAISTAMATRAFLSGLMERPPGAVRDAIFAYAPIMQELIQDE